MASIDLPSALSGKKTQRPGYSETPQDNSIRSKMGSGPPKARRRFTVKTEVIKMSWLLTTTEMAALETFYDDTLLGGTQKFNCDHPRTLVETDARFEGPYSVTGAAPGRWIASFNLRFFE